MRRLWIALAILALLAAAALLHAAALRELQGELSALLEGAQGAVAEGDWAAAQALTEEAAARWEGRAFYLHATLRHDALDRVRLSLEEVGGFLASRSDPEEYAAANARLRAELALLCEAEGATLRNIL